MHNDIPLGRGLGSSAAAIAGGLLLAATTLGIDDRPASLLKVALTMETHPDNIVAALWGGFTIGVQHDGDVLVHRINPPLDLRAVVLIPDQFSSTNESRAALPSSVTHADAVFNSSRTALLAAAFAEGNFELLRIAMEDRLHQPYRATGFCYLQSAIESAIAAGAYGAALSGAGSSVIALASPNCADVATALERVATHYGLRATVVTLSPDIAGATVRVRTIGAMTSLS
jgi:homoserine kinase